MNRDILLPLRRIHGHFYEWTIKKKATQQLPRNPVIIFPKTLYYTPDEDGAKKHSCPLRCTTEAKS